MKPVSYSSATLCVLLAQHALGRQGAPKKGLSLDPNTDGVDNKILANQKSDIEWYYNWELFPTEGVNGLEFFPMIHSMDAVEDGNLYSNLDSLPESSTHLLTFNEPDHIVDDGGSAISPEDAAKAYVEVIAPLRSDKGRKWKISHPSVTGSPKGLEWLQEFQSACRQLDPDNGCPADFASVHFYGTSDALTDWLEEMNDFYDDIPLWITEMALPSADAAANRGLLRDTADYLKNAQFVEGYAWFGAFRTDNPNGWVGKGASLLTDGGSLTELGAEYFGQ